MAVWAWTLGTSELGSTTRLGSNEGAGTAALVLEASGAGTTVRSGSGAVALVLSAVGAGRSPAGGSGTAGVTLAAVGAGPPIPGGLAPINEVLIAYLRQDLGMSSTDATVLVRRALDAAGGDATAALQMVQAAAVAWWVDES